MNKVWSPHQDKIFEWGREPKGNALISAYAGCGKTTTIVELHNRLKLMYPYLSICFMAFNKKIADELLTRNVKALTINAFGFRCTLKGFKDIKLDQYKIRNICKLEGVPFKQGGIVEKAVNLMKSYLYPRDCSIQSIKDIFHDFDLTDDKVEESFYDTVKTIFNKSLEQTATCDFTDQICLPIYHNLPVQKFDVVIIDESQDLSPNKLELVSRSVGKHIICVGDKFQAIYGFCGADSESMDKISQQFDPEHFTLPITYRCGKRIVQEAHNLGVAPEGFMAGETNPDGEVKNANYEEFLNTVKPEDFVLCRTTAPLVTGCFKLLTKGVRASIIGRDIGKQLSDLVSKINSYDTPDLDPNPIDLIPFAQRLAHYSMVELRKLRVEGRDNIADSLEDKLDCISVLMRDSKLVSDLKAKIENMFDDNVNPKAVVFSTIHKAKGLEANTVYCLPYKARAPKNEKQKQEEKNLLYVQITRAKQTLVWVRGEAK